MPYPILEEPGSLCHPGRRHELEPGQRNALAWGFAPCTTTHPSEFCTIHQLAHHHSSDKQAPVPSPCRTPAVTSHSRLGTAFGDVGGQGQLHQVHLTVLREVELTLPDGAQRQRLLGSVPTHSLSKGGWKSQLNPGGKRPSTNQGREPTLEGSPKALRKGGKPWDLRPISGNLAAASRAHQGKVRSMVTGP